MRHHNKADSFWRRSHLGWNPFLAIESLKLSTNDLLSNIFSPAENLKFRLPWVPATDLFHQGEELILELALPGVEKPNLEIHATAELLIIKGVTTPAPVQKKLFFKEIQRGEFFRVIPLPLPVNPDGISAGLKKGLLTIKLPLKSQAQNQETMVDIK